MTRPAEADFSAALRNDKRKQATTKANSGILRCAQNDNVRAIVVDHGYTFVSDRCFTMRHGLPTAKTLAGRLRVTMLPAPTMVFSPISMPGQRMVPPPSQALSQ